jgi:hypothetical protein
MARNKNRSDMQNTQYIERTQKKKKKLDTFFSEFLHQCVSSTPETDQYT